VIIPNATNACIPGACGVPDWNDPAIKATIAGNFAIPGSGGTSGAIGVLVDSDQGTRVQSKSNTATNRAVFTFQFPEATVLTGIEINVTAADIIRTATTMRVEASNDGTTYVPVSIDYVLGTNLTSGAPQYGGTASIAYTLPFADNDTEYTYYRVFAPTMRTNFNRFFTEIYFDYEFFDPQVTNITCDNNATLFEFDDDGVVFTMNPGPGTGTYDISLVGSTHTISPTTATYGAATTFTVSSGSAGDGDLTVRLIDANVPCVQEIVIPNETNACIPGACGGPDWNDPTIKSTVMGMWDVPGTPANQTEGPLAVLVDNDESTGFSTKSNNFSNAALFDMQFPEAAVLTGIEVVFTSAAPINSGTFVVEGSNDGTTYVPLSGNLVIGTNLNAGAPQYGSSASSAYTFPIPSNTDAYIYYRVFANSMATQFNRNFTELYFEGEVFDAQLDNISIDDNGTTALNDDKLAFELNPEPGTGSYTLNGSGGFTIAPGTGTYGQVTMFEASAGSAGSGDLTVQLIDASVPCVQDVVIPNPNIDLTVTATQAACASPSDEPLGTITVTGADGEVTKLGYSVGVSYSGPTFAAATDATNLPGGIVLVNNLANPASFTNYYTVRGYFSETFFKDYVVSLDRKACSVAELSLSISPSTDSGNEGEQLTYVVTINNAGPNPAQNVAVRVDIPTTLDVLTSTAALGEYSLANQLWTIDELPVGSSTLTITYRIQ